MRKRVGALLGLSAAIALIAVACTDSAHSPTAPVTSGSAKAGKLLGLQLLPPVHRTTPLAAPVSWSFTATPWGTVSSNSAVGLTVIVPYGALSTTQTITVTALPGNAVAYSFEPHLVFNRPVTLKQNLSGTDAGLLTSLVGGLLLSGGHFTGDNLEIDGNGLALLDETVPANILSGLLSRSASFNVGHFTGWILASGRDDGSDGSDGGY